MPDMVTHWHFARRTAEALPHPVRLRLERDIYLFTAHGPDVWFSYKFLDRRRVHPEVRRADRMHTSDTGRFLLTLAECARSCRGRTRDELFSYLAGFLCHYSLDTTCHPYIMTKTGICDDTPATLRYRGKHMKLEHGIDCLLLREVYRVTPARYSFARHMLPLRRLPESLHGPLDRVYKAVYGWDDTWRDLNTAIRWHRLFYKLLRDPTGILNLVLTRMDNGHSGYDLSQLSFHGREPDPALDVLNRSHRPWHHFCDRSIVSTKSFPELFADAKDLAAARIIACADYIYSDAPLPTELIGNLSYDTGLACGDPRAKGPWTFEPLYE